MMARNAPGRGLKRSVGKLFSAKIAGIPAPVVIGGAIVVIYIIRKRGLSGAPAAGTSSADTGAGAASGGGGATDSGGGMGGGYYPAPSISPTPITKIFRKTIINAPNARNVRVGGVETINRRRVIVRHGGRPVVQPRRQPPRGVSPRLPRQHRPPARRLAGR